MPEAKAKTRAEETLLFMMTLTFIGGFANGYSYFTRGGAFVSFHTGNITKLGIAAVTQDGGMFLACIVPILGGLLGAILAQLLKAKLDQRPPLFWQRATLLLELAAFAAVGAMPGSVSDDAVNFFLSMVMMFQLSNFRKFEGNVHNSTIETGNLRSLGAHLGDLLLKHDLAMLKKTGRYFVLVASFPVGALAGGFLGLRVGGPAIWVCSVLTALLAFGCLRRPETAPEQKPAA